MKTQYDKKQNIGMIALFIVSITLTAGLTAKLTKKANDNADKINQVTDDLANLEALAKQDKAKLLYQNTNITTMNSDDAMIDLPVSVLNDYSMIYVSIRVDEGKLNEYVLSKALFNNRETESIYFLNGDECGGEPQGDNGLLFGAILQLTKDDATLYLEFFQAYIGSETYSYNSDTNLYSKGEETFSSGIGVFDIIYGIK